MKTHAKDKSGTPLCRGRHNGSGKQALVFAAAVTCKNCGYVLANGANEARALRARGEELRKQATELDGRADHFENQQREAWELGYRPPGEETMKENQS